MQPTFSNLEVIKFAIGMEESGIEFYNEHAKHAKGDVKELFLRLASDEKQHALVFQKMYDEAAADEGQFGYLFDEEVTGFFQDYARSEGFSRDVAKIVTVTDALKEGIATEAITIAYYEDLLKYAKGDTISALERLIKEEQTHLEKLKALLELEA